MIKENSKDKEKIVIIKQIVRITKRQKAPLETKNEISNLIDSNLVVCESLCTI